MRQRAKATQDGAHEDRHHRAAQIVIPGELIPEPRRERQNPLPDGDIRQAIVHQVGGAFRHATAAATRAEPASFTRERDESIHATRPAVEPREPARQPAAPQERAEFLLDETRQAFSVALARGLLAKRLEMIADDLVQGTLRGTPGLVVE
jgi:hypothetical protein